MLDYLSEKCTVIKNNFQTHGKRLFAGTVGFYFDYFEKSLHFGPKLPYIKSGFRTKQGGIKKLEFKTNLQHPWHFTGVILEYGLSKKASDHLFLLKNWQFAYRRTIIETTHTPSSQTALCSMLYWKAWPWYKVQRQSLGPKHFTKFGLPKHTPPHTNF